MRQPRFVAKGWTGDSLEGDRAEERDPLGASRSSERDANHDRVEDDAALEDYDVKMSLWTGVVGGRTVQGSAVAVSDVDEGLLGFGAVGERASASEKGRQTWSESVHGGSGRLARSIGSGNGVGSKTVRRARLEVAHDEEVDEEHEIDSCHRNRRRNRFEDELTEADIADCENKD